MLALFALATFTLGQITTVATLLPTATRSPAGLVSTRPALTFTGLSPLIALYAL